MDDPALDTLILRYCSEVPQKLAMIIAKVSDIETSIDLDRVALRIEAFIEMGKLVATGDVADWRHSEIALASAH